MSSINKVDLLGRVGGDAEVKTLGNGSSVMRFSLATTEQWKDRNGTKQEKTTWHRVVMYGKAVERLAKYVDKGKLLFVEGKINNYEYEAQDGTKRYGSEVIALKLTFVSSGNGSGGGGRNQPREEEQELTEEGPFAEEPMYDSGNDEIPF